MRALAAPPPLVVALVLLVAATPRISPAQRAGPGRPGVGAIAEITAPADRQVVQRGDDDAATVAVRGRVRGDVERVLARARLLRGVRRGRAVPWRVLDRAIAPDGTFAGSVRLEAGGWYALELRVLHGVRLGPIASVDHVGVGEVFVVAGQSNACNFGERDRTQVPVDRVSAFGDDRWGIAASDWPYQFSRTGRDWEPAGNPLRFAYGRGGHPWVAMANRLVDALDVPVGLCPVAYPGSAIANWQPGGPEVVGIPGSRPFGHLVAALAALRDRGGVRAVLWHQGESDLSTPPVDYARMLETLIARSRAAAGVAVPWVIARVAYGLGGRPISPGADPCDSYAGPPTIRQAQCAVAASVSGCYPGPTTDDLGPPYRVGAHLNATGLRVHGERWADVLLHAPGLIPTGPGPGRPVAMP